MPFRFLISGQDTVEVCYYLRPLADCALDFQEMWLQRELLRQSKSREPRILTLGSESFLLKSHGSRNGFPFVMENDTYIVEFGEFNDPSFRVKFRSQPLWQHGVQALHQRFLDWADSVGFLAYKSESLSRVDFTFDYWIPEIDLDEDNMVSLSKKDTKYRDDGKINGLGYGKSDIVLRLYDKVLEIAEQSGKVWLFQLWEGLSENVWRVEWQTRQEPLCRFGIRTVEDLLSQQGDLLACVMGSSRSARLILALHQVRYLFVALCSYPRRTHWLASAVKALEVVFPSCFSAREGAVGGARFRCEAGGFRIKSLLPPHSEILIS